MTPTEMVDSAMDLMKKEGTGTAYVRLRKGKCQITDEEGYPYGDAAGGYDNNMAELVASTLRERGFKVEVACEHVSFRGSPVLEEFRRLSGVGPSLMEKASGGDRGMLDALSSAFPTKVKKADVPFIRYRFFRDAVEMQDDQDRLGGVLTSLSEREVDLGALMNWLKENGAKKVKKFGE